MAEGTALASSAVGSAHAILVGLSSPLTQAGLLPATAPGEVATTARALPSLADANPAALAGAGAAAWALSPAVTGQAESATTIQPEAAQATPSVNGHRPGEAAAAPPLTPAWITALQTPAPRLGPPPQPARERPARRDRPDHGHAGDDSPAAPPPDADAGPPTLPEHAEHRPVPSPWPAALEALLPPQVRAELARRRSVLLVAPPGAGQHGLQLGCMGFDFRGRPVCHRWAVRGVAAATQGTANWQFWRVRREGDDGQRPVLSARALSTGPDACGLVLRATATVLPAPLRPPHHGWLDVLEPQRLWRDLGSQWTLLLGWSPHPLPLAVA